MVEAFKSITGGITIKSETEGTISCVFASFNVRDLDGDVTIPGAFTDGEQVAISQFGHTIWNGTPPVGKGTIRQTSTEAIFDGQFFMDMPEARSTFAAVKGMGDQAQWSYGFETLDHEYGQFGGEQVKFLRKLTVFEVSPVLRAAGVGTRTLAAKTNRYASRPVAENMRAARLIRDILAGQDALVRAEMDEINMRVIRMGIEE